MHSESLTCHASIPEPSGIHAFRLSTLGSAQLRSPSSLYFQKVIKAGLFLTYIFRDRDSSLPLKMASENEEAEIPEEATEDVPQPAKYIYVRIPDSMVNQIMRYGIWPEKKSADSAHSSGVRGSMAYRRE